MQAGRVVVSDGTTPTWDVLPKNAGGSNRPVTAQYATQQLQQDAVKAVALPREPTADDSGAFLQYNGAFMLVRTDTMLPTSADTTGATGMSGSPVAGATGAAGAAGATGEKGEAGVQCTAGLVGATGAASASGEQGAQGAIVAGDGGATGVTGPARAALKTSTSASGSTLTMRRASMIVVPGAPISSSATYSMPPSASVSPTAAFEAVYTDGDLVPSSSGWTTSSAATMTLDLGSGSTYAVWSFGISAASTVTWTLRAETSVGNLALHSATSETVPPSSFREYVLAHCAWPASRVMLDVQSCTNVRVYFRLISVA
jgi:hypothetical protein